MPTGKCPVEITGTHRTPVGSPAGVFLFLCLSGTSQTSGMDVVRALATPIPLLWDAPTERNMFDNDMLQHPHLH